MKKSRNFGLVFLLGWVVFAQSCMFFRISDKDAAAMFTAKKVASKVYYQPVKGVGMHYVQTGADSLPTLFFIHGSPGSWEAFKDYLADSGLLAKYRLIAIDRPGFGYSDFGKAMNLEDQSSVISLLMDSLYNGKAFYVIGHSLGGPLCVRLAIDNPGKIAGLVLLSAAIDPALEKRETWRKVFMNNPLQYLLPGAFRPSNYELWYLKADLAKLQADIAGADLPFIWMVHGSEDNMVPFANVAYAKKVFPSQKMEVITIEGANHFIPWQHYSEIKAVLLRLPRP